MPLQAFFSYFQSLPGPKRLIGYSVYGDTYYAGPGE
jgi:tRNA (cytidine/uridine-2'-O-)-methyltransferase